MDRNVFVAIALSMSVLLFWGAFFETPKRNSEQQTNKKVEQKNEQDSIAPTINQPNIIKKITREESINSSKRIKIENDSIVCLLYTSPSPRDRSSSRMPSSA